MELNPKSDRPDEMAAQLREKRDELEGLSAHLRDVGSPLAQRLGVLLSGVDPDERDARQGEILRWARQAAEGLQQASGRLHLLSEVLSDPQLSQRSR